MAATLHRLRTKPEKAKDETANQLRLMMLAAPDLLPARLASQVMAALDQRDPSTSPWRFLLVSQEANRAVVKWLRQNSVRPMVAAELWAVCLERMKSDGEVMATRDELAAEVGVSAVEVSRLMGELVRFGAVSRKRQKIEGMRGLGPVQYFVNPNAASGLGGAARDKAQAGAPKFTSIEGGRAD